MSLHLLYCPLLTAEGDKASEVDTVAIHGLNPRSKSNEEYAWNTWRKPEREDGRLWLRNDLLKITRKARIFLYQYDSTAVYGHNQGTFIENLNELLEVMRVKRDENEDTKPLILLGQSLGGLLIRQALINARNNPKCIHLKLSTQEMNSKSYARF